MTIRDYLITVNGQVIEDADLCFSTVTEKLIHLPLVKSALTLVINSYLIYFYPNLIFQERNSHGFYFFALGIKSRHESISGKTSRKK